MKCSEPRSSFQMLRKDCWDVIWLTCSGCLSFGNGAVGGESTLTRLTAVVCPRIAFSSLHAPEYCRKEQEPALRAMCFLGLRFLLSNCTSKALFWAAFVQFLHLGVQTIFPAGSCPQNYSWWLKISSLILSLYFYWVFVLPDMMFSRVGSHLEQ